MVVEERKGGRKGEEGEKASGNTLNCTTGKERKKNIIIIVLWLHSALKM